MATTGTAPALETNGRIKIDLARFLPFLLSLIVFLGGYFALKQEVADLKESLSEIKQDVRDIRKDISNMRLKSIP